MKNLNIYTPDKESYVTGFGAHDRVIAFCPDSEGLYCRVDHLWNLPQPTEKQILEVARKQNGSLRRGWKLASVTPWDNGKSTDYLFKIA